MRRKVFIKLIAFVWIIVNPCRDMVIGQVIINEACAKNSDVISDFEGDFEDWIEIVNAGPDSLELEGYGLSDEKGLPGKWSFPQYKIAPGEYLLLFASGKDIKRSPLYWTTVIDRGEDWRYILPDAGTPLEWKNPDFDDSSWDVGPSGFGYGDDDDSTLVPEGTLSIFIRKLLYLENPSQIQQAVLHLDYDDAFVAYMNGQEIARSGISGTPPLFDAVPSIGREATIYGGGKPRRFDLTDPQDILREGENVIAIQVHNLSNTSSDLSAIPFFSILTSRKPEDQPPEVLDLKDFCFHTSFKLDADGYALYLSDPSALIIDSLVCSFSGENTSYGRLVDDPGRWAIYTTATPGKPNDTEPYYGYVSEVPGFSRTGGRFQSPFQLVLSSENPSDTIYYSLNGDDPDHFSSVYTEPIEINSGTVVRATILKAGYLPGRIITHTYYTGKDNHLPVLAISTDPYNLWDYDEGIYVMGPDAGEDFPYFNANFWKDWEKPAHIEFFDNEGNPGFNLDGGIKIYGGWTRGLPQKSMSIFARSKYGSGSIEYKLFENKSIDEFESIVIRNSGNDWFGEEWVSGTMFRDLLMTRLAANMDVEYQAGRQAIVYLNGEYWGIQNIREKINEHFIAANAGADPEQLDLLENNMSVIHGSNDHYRNLIQFLETNDIRKKENYDYVKTQMDIQNFISYQVSQIYFDNTDWPSNNIKYWRPDTPSGIWRWILFDTDFGFGLWDPNKVYHNTLEFATEAHGPDYPNPPWSTYLLRRLLENQEFKALFINSFADQINTSFRFDAVQDLIGTLKETIDEEMLNHANKWGGSYQQWVNRTRELSEFAQLRPSTLQNYIKSTLHAGEKAFLNLNVSDTTAGSIQLNSIHINEFPWKGTYFSETPVVVTAVPDIGYRFSHWSGSFQSELPRIQVNLPLNSTLIANFEIDPEYIASPVMINEIFYRQDSVPDPEDWVELHNNSSQYVDIGGWTLMDSDDTHSFSIRQGTLIPPYGYIVICREQVTFETVYPTVSNVQGSFGFGFSSSGELIRLFDRNGIMVDTVEYGIDEPWPSVPQGSNLSIVLLDPDLDNYLAGSWGLSDDPLGTPGGNNSFKLDVEPRNIYEQSAVLFQASPNPFNYETRILLYLGKRDPVQLAVFDLNGRFREILVESTLEPGYYEFIWGADEQDAGIYILRLETPGRISTQKIVKIR